MALPSRNAYEDALDRGPGGDPVEPDRDLPSSEPGRWSIWTEEPARSPRMPDPVRNAAVRAGLVVAVALVCINVAALAALARSWTAAPAMLVAMVAAVVATWAVLDVWVTRQVYIQRHGVVSSPSSAARESRREARARARQAKARERRRRHPGSRPHLTGV